MLGLLILTVSGMPGTAISGGWDLVLPEAESVGASHARCPWGRAMARVEGLTRSYITNPQLLYMCLGRKSDSVLVSAKRG